MFLWYNKLYFYFSFDKETNMEKVRIQDDLYMFVNQETLENLVIPDDKPTAGGFMMLADACL